jgi:DNA-binding transcriptional LysR family regulator
MPLEPGPLAGEELIREEFHVVVAETDPLSRQPKLEVGDLDGVQLVCLRRCRATETALARLQSQDVRPTIVYRSDDAGMLLGLVRSGAAVALLPALEVDATTRDVVVRSLEGAQLHRRIGIAWRRDHPPTGIGTEFVEVVRSALGRRRTIAAEAS